ncbi:hypothetical protein [Candidatus Thioglobus sp. NP1]|uniref:hypothetical protein n=1 Tax=Candidatus Thioglobus sp. NP1 TaxID=2508687 RepID=UPI00143C3537|nr:hypothetical protein [Candidatus Thioglobus sp. NP1]
MMNFNNQTYIRIQHLSVEALYVLNSPDIIGLHNESHSHKCYPQGRDPGGNRQEPKAY